MRLLYFSPVHWDSYDQRAHYFVRHFLMRGGEAAWWVNPYPARLPRPADVTREDRRQPPVRLERPDRLTVVDVTALPIDPLPGGARLNRTLFWRGALARMADFAAAGDTMLAIGRPTALARAALRALPHRWSLYDAMDDFPEFYDGLSRRSTSRVERAIASAVDRILAPSPGLTRKFEGPGRLVSLVPNAFDMSLLPASIPEPPSSTTLGFIGCMGRWFDWELVATLAAAIAPATVTLVGPRPTAPSGRLPDNVTLHPPCSQRDAVAWLPRFSAGLIPFTQTALTAGVDPIKFYQYRGAGLPILSTRFGTMAERTVEDSTFLLDRAADFSEIVGRALAGRPAEPDVRRFREAHTWTRRFDEARVFEPQTPLRQ